MHPLFHEHLALERRARLQREVAAARRAGELADQHMASPLLWYLLLGGSFPTKPLYEQDDVLERLQDRWRKTASALALLALALGSLVGSLLDSRYGLLPAIVFSFIVLLLTGVPMLGRSLHLLRVSIAHR